MTPTSPEEQLRAENADLRARLEEAEETLRAIRSGEVEALVVETSEGPQIFTLQGLDAESNRFRGEILSQVSDSVIAMDLEQCVTYLNAAAERLYRISAGDVLGRQLSHLFSRKWPSAEAEAAMWLALREHGEWRGEIIHRTHDGRELQVEAWLTLLRDVDGAAAGMVIAIRDITERKRSAAEFQRVSELLDTLLRTAPIGFCFLDRDLRYLRINERLAEINGIPAEAHLGRHVSEIVPTLVDTLRAVTGRILATGEAVLNHEFSGETSSAPGIPRFWSQSWYPVRDGAAEVLGFGAVVEDITERKQAEAALRSSEIRYRRLFEAAKDGVLILDGQTGQITDANPYTLEVLGRTHAEALGRELWEIGVFADATASRAAMAELQERGYVRYEDLPLESKTGLRREVEVVANVYQENGHRVIQCNIRDITERKAAKESLRLTAEELARSARAKDDFLAALSHELRTPLTPVLMAASELESDPALPPEMRDQLKMMRRNIELEARLIDDLLDITRISRGKLSIAPVLCDLHQLLQRTAEIVRSDELGAQVRVVFQLEAARQHALVDPPRMQQVFWNLIKNALKFTPTGGSIVVRTRNDAEGWIVMSVEDSGVGISAEALPHIFRAFEQGDVAGQHRYGGLGLGLAISQAIVDVHGGAIHADSAGPGRGATFTVVLATVDAPATPAHPVSAQPPPARALRLLVVEDHEATRTVLSRLLTRTGHQVTTAGTIHEAHLAFSAERFDAVISDLGLPDGSGLDLMREIQRQRPVPGIALSGYGMENDLRQTKEAGFIAHLVKPVDFDQLRQILIQLSAPH